MGVELLERLRNPDKYADKSTLYEEAADLLEKQAERIKYLERLLDLENLAYDD